MTNLKYPLAIGLYSGEDSTSSFSVPGRETSETANLASDLAYHLDIGRLIMTGINADRMVEISKSRYPNLNSEIIAMSGNGDIVEDVVELKARSVAPNISRFIVCSVDYKKELTEFVFDQVFGKDISIDFRYVDTKKTAIVSGTDRHIDRKERSNLRAARRKLGATTFSNRLPFRQKVSL